MSRWRAFLERLRRAESAAGVDGRAAALRAWSNRGTIPQDVHTLALCLRLSQFQVEARASSHGISLDGRQPPSRWPIDEELADELRVQLGLVLAAQAGDRAALERLADRHRADGERLPPILDD